MKHYTAIKMILVRRRISKTQVAKKLGAKSTNEIFAPIRTKTCYINRVVDVLDALGYQLVFRPKGDGTTPEGCYPIRWSDYQIEE